MRLIGAAAIFCAAFAAMRAFSSYQTRRLAQCRGFLNFIRYAKRELACYSRPLGAWIGDFREDALEAVGFLKAARESEDLPAALRSLGGRLCVGEEAKELLRTFVSAFGKGYREEEIARLAWCEEEMERITAREERVLPGSLRLTRTLVGAGATAAVILLL